MWAGMAMFAQAQTLQSIEFTPGAGGQVELQMQFSAAPPDPQVFTTDEPARIALDLAGVSNGLAERVIQIGNGATRSVSAVEAAGRTRVVIDLFRPSSFDTSIDGNTLRLRIDNGFAANQVQSAVRADPTKRAAVVGTAVQAVDFRRGPGGEGRVLIDFSAPGVAVDIKQNGNDITVEMFNVDLPDELQKRFDVLDFATPVQSMALARRGNGASMTVRAGGNFEQLAYQTGSQYVLEIAPVVVDPADDKRKDREKVYEGTRVTFNFQDIPVRSALQLIADVSSLNIVVADTVQGSTTLRLVNVPWDQALDIILNAKGLDKRQSGNVIWIAPAQEIADREQQQADARIAMEDRAETISVFLAINYSDAESLAKLLTTDSLSSQAGGGAAAGGQGSQLRRGFLSPRGSISFDKRTNTLLVSDIPERVNEIQELVETLDRPVQQVLIESRIVVATEGFSREIGARFGVSAAYEDSQGNLLTTGGSALATDRMIGQGLRNRFLGLPSALPVGTAPLDPGGPLVSPPLGERLNVNIPVPNPAGSFAFAILSHDYLLDLELSALESEGRGEVISSPKVITASQQEAMISQGSEIPYSTVTRDNETGNLTSNVQFKQVLLQLKVTPTISPDQRVFMNLDVRQDSPAGFSPDGQVIIDTRNVTTSLLVDNGQTVVLGGIYEQQRIRNTNKVPFLGDLPAVGPLFRNRRIEDGKSELLIFVTPKILSERLN